MDYNNPYLIRYKRRQAIAKGLWVIYRGTVSIGISLAVAVVMNKYVFRGTDTPLLWIGSMAVGLMYERTARQWDERKDTWHH